MEFYGTSQKLERKIAVTSGPSVVSSGASVSEYEELHRYNWMAKYLAQTNTSQLTSPKWTGERRGMLRIIRDIESCQFYEKGNFHCHLPQIPQNRRPGLFAGSTTWE